MTGLTPIEDDLRVEEPIDPVAALVIRRWPLTVEGLLRNANATRRRFSFQGESLVAVSAEVTGADWDVQSILSRSRLRTRRSYASVPVRVVTEAGFLLLPTFAAPHYSIVLANYTEQAAQRLIAVLGPVRSNPYFVRRSHD